MQILSMIVEMCFQWGDDGLGQHKRRTDILLKFDKIECERCGGERLLTRNCDDCGQRPKSYEIQNDLQRRKRCIEEFRTNRKAPDRNLSPSLYEVGVDADVCLRHVLEALSELSRAGQRSDALVAAFANFDQMVVSWTNPLPRPNRNRGKLIGFALSRLADGVNCFVEALCAPDIHAAQSLESSGNGLIEEARKVLHETSHLDFAEETFASGSPMESMAKVGRDARLRIGWEASLTDLDFVLSEGVGWDAAVTGMGLQSHAIKLLAQYLFDLDRFTEVISATINSISEEKAVLGNSDEWRSAHARAAAQISSGAISIHHMVSSEDAGTLEIVQSALSAVATWRDGVLRHALATVLADQMDGYSRLAKKSGGQAIKKAEQMHPELGLNESLNPELRHAGGHGGADLSPSGVRIGDLEVSYEDFLDSVLSYLETTLAVFVGVSLSMAKYGADLSCDKYLAPRDRHAAVALFLGTFDLECDSIWADETPLVICVRGPEPDWLQLSAFLSALFPESVDDLEIRQTTQHGDRVFSTSLERFRNIEDDIGARSSAAEVVTMSAIVAASRVDGASLWGDDEWSQATQVVTRRDTDTDLRQWVKGIRSLRSYASEADRHDVVASCENALAELRNNS